MAGAFVAPGAFDEYEVWRSTERGDGSGRGDRDEESAAGGGEFFGDEHGMVTRPKHRAVSRGDRVEFTAPHCDPTIDRYDLLHLVRGDVLVDVVRVEGRGASQ